jgi:hypothetical protein
MNICFGFTETRIMEICGWKSRSMFQRYALTNPADLKREIPKPGEYWEHARAGRKAVATVVARRGAACRSEQRRASVRNNRAEIGQTSRKPAARALPTEFAAVRVAEERRSYPGLEMVARDGVEPPTPAFSGLSYIVV